MAERKFAALSVSSTRRLRPGGSWQLRARVAGGDAGRALFLPESAQDHQPAAGLLGVSIDGHLAELESAVEEAERAESLEAAAEEVRPSEAVGAVTLPSAPRWLRGRLVPVRAALLAAVTLVTELSECKPTVAAIRERLGVRFGVRFVLEALRSVAARHLSAMTAPVGLCARGRRLGSVAKTPRWSRPPSREGRQPSPAVVDVVEKSKTNAMGNFGKSRVAVRIRDRNGRSRRDVKQPTASQRYGHCNGAGHVM